MRPAEAFKENTMMMVRIAKIGAALSMCGTASIGLACDLPPLVMIPEKGAVGDKGPQLQLEVQKYYDAMKTYSACVQAELTAAGGDSAPTLVKAVLVQRNNSAVAEVQVVMKVFQESVGGAAAAPPGAAGDEGRRRDR
jgi:hypothetical protein